MRLEHRVFTRASPEQVWAVLGTPSRWPGVELFLRDVRGGISRVVAGQRLMGLVRLSTLGIPVDVLEVVPQQRLVLLVHTAPGLREQLTVDLTPAVAGGTDVRVHVAVEGPLALAGAVPMWLASGLTTRVLAARTDRAARRDRG